METENERRLYNLWFAAVDKICEEIVGIGADELPDQEWWDWFAAGTSPKTAARRALKREGFLGKFN